MMTFTRNSPNQLLVNPRLSEAEKAVFKELQREFDLKVTSVDHFLIASSGSTQKNNSSAKLIALSQAAVLNSAARFNLYFKAGTSDHWGLVLPKYHVAGLGIFARAQLAGANVHEREWQVKDLSGWIQGWIHQNGIKFISLVPAQIFDVVNSVVSAPVGLRKVFVGAGALDPELRTRALALSWPLCETYGMTETASMIAVKEQELFRALPGIEIKTEAGILNVKCNSLLSATIQKVEEQIIINQFIDNDWFATEDLATIEGTTKATDKATDKATIGFRFLGRQGDYIKILGEGVSLNELRSQIARLATANGYNPAEFELIALDGGRAGFRLILTVEGADTYTKAEKLMSLYNLSCRPFEKIAKCVVVGQIPRTALGKLKTEDLKLIVREIIKEIITKD